ncbi:MAG: type II secretion system protein [Thermoguttaceae bacterium]
MQKKAQGFTLTELLIVIVIIGILASLALVGVMAARRAVVTGAVRSQLSQMEMALEKYKADFGEYPPNLTDVEACVRHAQMRWPRASNGYWDIFAAALAPCYDCWADQITGTTTCTNPTCGYKLLPTLNQKDVLDQLNTAAKLSAANVNIFPMRCRTALIERTLPFWLGGTFDYKTGKFTGFSADKENPFSSLVAQREEPRFDFQEGKNMQLLQIKESAFMSPADVETTTMAFMIRQFPVAYFRARIGDSVLAYPQKVVMPPSNTFYFPIGGDLKQTRLMRRNVSGAAVSLTVEGDENFGSVVPYAKTGGNPSVIPPPPGRPTVANWQTLGVQWYNDDKYQLIYPGMDGKFGNDTRDINNPPSAVAIITLTPAGLPNSTISSLDLDNVVNFGSTGTLDGEVEQ